MTQSKRNHEKDTGGAEPRGFGEHTRGLAGEYAHEQGWELYIDERTNLPPGPLNSYGGKDYEYGARDFGDEPVNTEIDRQVPDQTIHEPATRRKRREV